MRDGYRAEGLCWYLSPRAIPKVKRIDSIKVLGITLHSDLECLVMITAFPNPRTPLLGPVKHVTWPLTIGSFRPWPYAIAVNT